MLPLNTVTDFVNRVTELCSNSPEQEQKKPTFFVVGPVNSGKSTLINQLLEKHVCPEEASPSIMFPVHFHYSENPSFHKTVRGNSKQIFEKEWREALKSRKKSPLPDRADIYLPSVILKWCSLVDTPGIGLNDDSDILLRNSLSKANGIIYLFHQRGIDTVSHRFLTDLSAAGIRGWISFWINANLGLIDGTSLTDTNQALKLIFPGRSEINAINTKDRSSTALISTFLQVKALEIAIQEIEKDLSKRDKLIPSLLERLLMIKEEDHFLVKFWNIIEEAEIINSGNQSLRDLPLIYSSMTNMLRTNTSRLTIESIQSRTDRKGKRIGHDAREMMFSLINELAADKNLIQYIDRKLLVRAAERLSEKCKVMVAGPFSTGKTTFLNALLGETLLPAEDRATTSCAVKIQYGLEEIAEVEYLYKAEFSPVSYRNKISTIDRQEMLALTQILENPSLRSLLVSAEICRDGIKKSIALSELSAFLDEACRSYSKEAMFRKDKESFSRIPLFSRKIAVSSLPGPTVSNVQLTLGNQDRLLFRLEDDRQRLSFYKTISPPGSYLLDNVTINYPSPNLLLADFIDTPGLDSLHKRHYDQASRALSSGDLLLTFLNAKHVLTEGIPKHVTDLLSLDINLPIFYVINFADTLSNLECEKVSLYVRQNLCRNMEQHSGGIIPYPQVYTISSLNAIRNRDDGFERLLRRLQKKIADIQNIKTSKVIQEVRECLQKIKSGQSSGRYNTPASARQAAERYLGGLERIQKLFFGNGGK